jgi:ribose transport system substrate-binding protein
MTDEVHVTTSNHNRYLVKSLVHASRVLEAFQSTGDVLRLRDVVARTGFNKGMCFRLLYTLHQCGFLDKVGENHYRLASEVKRRRLYRIGYAARGRTRLSTRKCAMAWCAPPKENTSS